VTAPVPVPVPVPVILNLIISREWQRR
jgi:hypothetical protein